MSKLFGLEANDWLKGLIVAVLTTPVTIIYDSASSGILTLDWTKIGAAALAGGLGYLIKNFLTGENGKLLSNKTTTEPLK